MITQYIVFSIGRLAKLLHYLRFSIANALCSEKKVNLSTFDQKVDEDVFPVPPIVLAASSDYFYAIFTNGIKGSNQEIIELKDESITSNALEIILEIVLENIVIIARINELKSHF